MQFLLVWRVNQRFLIFSAKHDMDVIFYQRLSHIYLYFALSGLLIPNILLYDGLHPSLLDFAHSGLSILYSPSDGFHPSLIYFAHSGLSIPNFPFFQWASPIANGLRSFCTNKFPSSNFYQNYSEGFQI